MLLHDLMSGTKHTLFVLNLLVRNARDARKALNTALPTRYVHTVVCSILYAVPESELVLIARWQI